jgi:hypothetical protein
MERSLESRRRRWVCTLWRVWVRAKQQYEDRIPELLLDVLGRVGVLDWERDPVVRGRESCAVRVWGLL